MQLFQWDQSFHTGSEVVDRQHQQLIDIINRFGSLMLRDASGAQEIISVCAELVDYTNYHFAEEERLMVAAGLDQRHIAQHVQQHADLLRDIEPFHQFIVTGRLDTAHFMFEFLVNWLVFHILGTDLLMARQIEAISRGISAEEAYSHEEVSHDRASGLLLTAVKKLLFQISSRNRQLLRLNETLEQKVEERTRELSVANVNLRELASTDSLTGILNRRVFLEEARSMLTLANRYQRPLSLLMIDADHFKRVNDSYGHQVGDQVLLRLSQTMHQCLRETDIIGRIGGEEFAVILAETGLDQTTELTERLLNTIRGMSIDVTPTTSLKITVSIGVATVPSSAADIDDLMKAADAALYQAKREGRDRCCGIRLSKPKSAASAAVVDG